MKFTNGYWLTKPEYDLHFAIESYSATITEKSLRIICPSVPVHGRGDIMKHLSVEYGNGKHTAFFPCR